MSLRFALFILIVTFLMGGLMENTFISRIAIILLATITLAWLWQRQALQHILYTRKITYPNGFPGDKTDITISVKNDKWLPLSWLRLIDHWPNEIKPENKAEISGYRYSEENRLTNIFTLRWYEKINRKFNIEFKKRGIYQIGPVEVESGDFLGLFSKTTSLPIQDTITVYPALLPMDQIQWDTDDPFGEKSTHHNLFSDPNLVSGIRSYQPGDRFRTIHWPATARKGTLQVKTFQPVTAKSIMIMLNSSTTEHAWMGYSSDMLEYAIQVSASLAYYAIQAGYAVGLCSNGYLTRSDQPFFLSPGNTQAQLIQILTYLAMVTAYTNVNFEKYLIRSSPKIPYGTNLVIVSAMHSERLSRTLMHLNTYRKGIIFYNLTNDNVEIPGIRQTHLPLEKHNLEVQNGE
ncbi:MAG: DUF58 domain-containing protein [Anaerolineaceae bacterium]|nr:DUF58 domain-containing protein [Anaerolineaceae bacterium]